MNKNYSQVWKPLQVEAGYFPNAVDMTHPSPKAEYVTVHIKKWLFNSEDTKWLLLWYHTKGNSQRLSYAPATLCVFLSAQGNLRSSACMQKAQWCQIVSGCLIIINIDNITGQRENKMAKPNFNKEHTSVLAGGEWSILFWKVLT